MAKADMEDVVHMKLKGKMVEVVEPKLYHKYVQMENGKTVLYIELKKALYGTMKAALLFWKKLTAELKKWGFVVTPYNWCIMNKMPDGKQCTVLWHVDDLKILHVDPVVVTGVIKQLKKNLAQRHRTLTKTCGVVHDYLGMTLDFCTRRGQQSLL
jgi:hypothetical protein